MKKGYYGSAVIDGSKGIAKAIDDVFPTCGVVQRCHYHKVENVVSYLPRGIQGIWRAKLRAVYKNTSFETAKKALMKLYDELYNINPSAASSLQEGMDETLTLHKLQLCEELGKSFTSTNCIESVMSQLGQYTDKVDRWRGGSHIQRWAASGLIALEPRLNKVKGFRHLNLLQTKLCEEVERRKKKHPLECSINDDLGAGVHLATPKI